MKARERNVDTFMKRHNIKHLHDISKSDKKDSILLIGCGSSIDRLNIKALETQTEFDIMTVSDAVRVVKNPKFSLHLHWQSISRAMEHKGITDDVGSILIANGILLNLLHRSLNRASKLALRTLEKYSTRTFKLPFCKATKKLDIDKDMDLNCDEVVLLIGSSFTAVHFLAGYMGYKHIRYVGFDGGTKYGKLTDHGRKIHKVKSSVLEYKMHWDKTLYMLRTYYPDVSFERFSNYE